MSAQDKLKAAANKLWRPTGWTNLLVNLDTALEIVSRLEDELTTAYATGGKDALLEKIVRMEQRLAHCQSERDKYDIVSIKLAEERDALLEKVERLEQENARLKQFVTDTAEGMECLPGCDSTAHAELCPVANPVEAWRALRRENAELREAIACCFAAMIGKVNPYHPAMIVAADIMATSDTVAAADSSPEPQYKCPGCGQFGLRSIHYLSCTDCANKRRGFGGSSPEPVKGEGE